MSDCFDCFVCMEKIEHEGHHEKMGCGACKEKICLTCWNEWVEENVRRKFLQLRFFDREDENEERLVRPCCRKVVEDVDFVELASHFTGTTEQTREEISYAGKITYTETWMDGLLHGPTTGRREDGSLFCQREYSFDNRVGRHTTYSPEGTLMSENIYAKDGSGRRLITRIFREDGTISCSSKLTYCQCDCPRRRRKKPLTQLLRKWHPNGQLASEEKLCDDVRIGYFCKWNEAGEIIFQEGTQDRLDAQSASRRATAANAANAKLTASA